MDYKKAWQTFKKEMMKDGDPLHLKGCCYMTASQIAKHTATIDLGICEKPETMEAARRKASFILSIGPYKRLAEAIDIKSFTLEVKENPYYHKHLYMRLHY